jgi:hypothetical protein
MPELIATYKRAVDQGAAQCEVELSTSGEQRFVSILNFEEQFDLMVVVVQPPHADGGLMPELSELGPEEFQVRDRSMEQIVDEASVILSIDQTT